jgi:capsule polysaccharide modification protein KpsS
MNILILQRHQRKFINHLNFTLMNKTISVHFRLKKRSSYVVGENLPIYLRLTIDGDRTEFSTQREIDPAKWNSKKGRAVATTKEETRQLNSFLETM